MSSAAAYQARLSERLSAFSANGGKSSKKKIAKTTNKTMIITKTKQQKKDTPDTSAPTPSHPSYLFPIGCFQRVARISKDHPGGYRQILISREISDRGAGHYEPLGRIQQRCREQGSLENSQRLYNIGIVGWPTDRKKTSVFCIGVKKHLYSQIHTRRWMDQPSGPVH